jgi:hypothetical protein
VTPGVREILSWYGDENLGTPSKLARLLSHGRLGVANELAALEEPALEEGAIAVDIGRPVEAQLITAAALPDVGR